MFGPPFYGTPYRKISSDGQSRCHDLWPSNWNQEKSFHHTSNTAPPQRAAVPGDRWMMDQKKTLPGSPQKEFSANLEYEKIIKKMYDECMRPSICLSVRLSIRLSLSVSTNCVYRSVCWSSLKYSSWMVLRAYHRYHPNKTVWSHSPPSNTTKPVWKSLSNPIKTP